MEGSMKKQEFEAEMKAIEAQRTMLRQRAADLCGAFAEAESKRRGLVVGDIVSRINEYGKKKGQPERMVITEVRGDYSFDRSRLTYFAARIKKDGTPYDESRQMWGLETWTKENA
jgi:hypothetical protein